MVWHIFKKDCRALWRWIVLVGATQAGAAIWAALSWPGDSVASVTLIAFVAMLGVMLLSAKVVQQDGLLDIQQDWHVRPIRRGHLLLAKLLFVLVIVHGPMFLTDFAVGLGFGYPVLDCARAALLRGIAILCFMSLPAMVLATMTRSVLGAIGAGWAILLSFFVLLGLGGLALEVVSKRWDPAAQMSLGTGVAWIEMGAMALVVLIGAAAILRLRYLRRSTARAHGLLAAAVILAAAVPVVLWKAAFAIQQQLSPRPDLASSVSLTFDPTVKQQYSDWTMQGMEELRRVNLTLRISGLRPDSLVVRDKVTTLLSTLDGTRVYSNTYGLPFSVVTSHETENGQIQEILNLPADLYARVKNEPLRVDIDYVLTLMQRDAAYRVPGEIDVPRWLGDLGWCTTGSRFGSIGNLRCLSLHKPPSCIQTGIEWHLMDTGTLSYHTNCRLNYTPVGASIFPGVMHRIGDGSLLVGELRAVSSSSGGLAEERGPSAQQPVFFGTFTPRAHFTRKLVIPSIRLADLVESAKQNRENRPAH